MKVLLIQPPFSQPRGYKKRCLVPLGLAYIAGYLVNKNVKVSIVDCVVEGYNEERIDKNNITFGLSLEELKNKIEDYKPDVVGVSCLMTIQKHNTIDVCNLIKSIDKNIKVVVGGAHPSNFPNEMLSEDSIDCVVIGEGERAMYEIVRDNLTGIVTRPIKDIDSLPWPAHYLLPIEKYFKINMPENMFSPNKRVMQVVTSRGCPFKCVYCATTGFHGNWRGRDPMNVIKEIRSLIDCYDIDEVNFVDENLVMDRDRVVKIMEGLAIEGIAWSNPGGIWIAGLDEELITLMKKAGCYQLTFPVENSNEDILKNVIHKPLKLSIVKPLVEHAHKLGISVHAFFVEGFPEQTKQDMLNDYKYALDTGFDSASFHIITPLPGSPIYHQYKDVVNLDEINYVKSTIPHPILSPEEIEETVNYMNVNFNKSLKWRNPLLYFKNYYWLGLKKFGIRGILGNSLMRRK